MNNTARSILGIGAIVVIALALVGGGIFFGHMSGASAYGRNMMSGFTSTGNSAVGATGAGTLGGGMMGGTVMGGNMMGGTFGMMSGAGNAASTAFSRCPSRRHRTRCKPT